MVQIDLSAYLFSIFPMLPIARGRKNSRTAAQSRRRRERARHRLPFRLRRRLRRLRPRSAPLPCAPGSYPNHLLPQVRHSGRPPPPPTAPRPAPTAQRCLPAALDRRRREQIEARRPRHLHCPAGGPPPPSSQVTPPPIPKPKNRNLAGAIAGVEELSKHSSVV
jgi:hypothetical protein